MKAPKVIIINSASLLLAVSPSMGADQIRLVDLPVELESSFIESIAYDNTGESIAIVAYTQGMNGGGAVLYQYREGVWDIIAQDSDKVPVRWIGGIADAGASVVFSNDGAVHLASNSGIEQLPDSWIGVDGQLIKDAAIFSTAISGDAGTVGVYAYDPIVEGEVPLVWRGGETLETLEIGLPGSGIDSFIQAMNHDGSVIAGQSIVSGQINNIRLFPDIRVPWVWRDGSLKYIDIPNKDGLDEFAYPRCVSADGTTVAGSRAHPTLVRSYLSSSMFSVVYDYSNWDAWVWSADDGVTVISDPRFDVIEVFDISADGQTLLLGCNAVDGQSSGSYLWTREGGFVFIHEHLSDNGVIGPEEAFHCEAISDDASTLMGWYSPAQGDSTLAFIDLN